MCALCASWYVSRLLLGVFGDRPCGSTVFVYTVLHIQITPLCLSVCLLQRKDYRVLTECLPSKHEYVLKIRLSPVQEQLYCALLEQRGSDGVIQSIFKFFQTMMRVSGSAGLATVAM